MKKFSTHSKVRFYQAQTKVAKTKEFLPICLIFITCPAYVFLSSGTFCYISDGPTAWPLGRLVSTIPTVAALLYIKCSLQASVQGEALFVAFSPYSPEEIIA